MIMAAMTTNKGDLARSAKRYFFVNLFDLSWRMAGAMLLPLFIGLYIDSKRTGNGQGFGLAGFAVGMVCGAFMLRRVVKKLAEGAKDA